MTITPQPQPASYWKNLFEDLTGIEVNPLSFSNKQYENLYDYLTDNWNITGGYPAEYISLMFEEAKLIVEGKLVLGAVMFQREYYHFHRFDNSVEGLAMGFLTLDNLDNQIELFCNCIGYDSFYQYTEQKNNIKN